MDSRTASAMLVAQLVSFLFPASLAVDADCNYRQQLQPGTTYYVYNKEYPGLYRAGASCRWVGVAPAGHNVELQCSLEIPQSSQCGQDRLLVSLVGNADLNGAHTFCGYGNTTQLSTGTNITVGLVSSPYSQSGRFLCTMTAKPAPVPPAPSCDCGWKFTRRIVGGVETKVNEYPMMAGLVDALRRELYCGGTIVSDRYAVTAAHCLVRRDAASVGLLVGEHNTSSATETDATQLLRVAAITVHPDFSEADPKDLNDIGLVRTERPIAFNLRVGPACLPFRHYRNQFAGQPVEVLGWGTTEFTGPRSDVLLKADVDVVPAEQCRAQIGAADSQMCTFRRGHDACQSDSGGPVLWQDAARRVHFVGVIASGIGCASSRPAINTRVTAFLMWIVSNTPDAQYCVK